MQLARPDISDARHLCHLSQRYRAPVSWVRRSDDRICMAFERFLAMGVPVRDLDYHCTGADGARRGLSGENTNNLTA